MKIYHITSEDEWKNARNQTEYFPIGFSKEGFIHCSNIEQFIRVANAKYKGRKDLILLEIDTVKIHHSLKSEKFPGMIEAHPHIYGGLNIDAVNHVFKLEPDVNGFFQKPTQLK